MVLSPNVKLVLEAVFNLLRPLFESPLQSGLGVTNAAKGEVTFVIGLGQLHQTGVGKAQDFDGCPVLKKEKNI